MNLLNDDLVNICNHQNKSSTQYDFCEKCGAIILDKVIQYFY